MLLMTLVTFHKEMRPLTKKFDKRKKDRKRKKHRKEKKEWKKEKE